MKPEAIKQDSYHDLLPNYLSDETAFFLSEFLNTLALTCDEKYFAQLRRYAEHLYQPPVPGVDEGFSNGDEEDDSYQ